MFQIEQYKTEIKRLQSSEAEIRALSVNYAALLKEKEVSFFFLEIFSVLYFPYVFLAHFYLHLQNFVILRCTRD